MFDNKKVAVVVPAYNEETQIAKVIGTMPEYIDKIIIVDDCSSDNTVGVVEAHPSINDGVVLLKHEKNSGVGAAIASGYVWARDNDMDMAVVMAGDGQMDPADLPALLEPVASGRVGYSKANRLVSGEAYMKIPKIRYFGNSVLSLLTKVASGYWHVADSQTGYTAINKEMLHRIDWDKMYARYGQPNDLLVRLNVEGCKVCDVPTEPVYDVGEKSGIKVRKVVFTISWLLLKRFVWRLKEKYIIRDFHPLVFFYAFGFLLLTIGGGMFVRVLQLWKSQGHTPEISLLTFFFCIAMGMQSIFFAMWLDMDYNKDTK